MKLLHIHREILELALQAPVGPELPAPPMIARPVADLLMSGLLAEIDGRATITDAGRAALGSSSEATSASGVPG